MKNVDAVPALDTTPYWPVVEVFLGDTPTVKVHGITRSLKGDAQAAAVAVAAGVARSLGRRVRMRVASGTGVQVLVVAPNGAVVRLPDANAKPAEIWRRRLSRTEFP